MDELDKEIERARAITDKSCQLFAESLSLLGQESLNKLEVNSCLFFKVFPIRNEGWIEVGDDVLEDIRLRMAEMETILRLLAAWGKSEGKEHLLPLGAAPYLEELRGGPLH